LGRELLKIITKTNFYRIFDNFAIISTFWGGFAVDADFTDGFSGSIEDPKIIKNR
jgi:hypothetical protein